MQRVRPLRRRETAVEPCSRWVEARRGEKMAGTYTLGQVQELLVHSGDRAKAIGAGITLGPELMDVSYARAVRNRERLRTAGSTV